VDNQKLDQLYFLAQARRNSLGADPDDVFLTTSHRQDDSGWAEVQAARLDRSFDQREVCAAVADLTALLALHNLTWKGVLTDAIAAKLPRPQAASTSAPTPATGELDSLTLQYNAQTTRNPSALENNAGARALSTGGENIIHLRPGRSNAPTHHPENLGA